VVIDLMGIFYIGTNKILHDRKQEEKWKGAENGSFVFNIEFL
jgi:hypothetical protein